MDKDSKELSLVPVAIGNMSSEGIRHSPIARISMKFADENPKLTIAEVNEMIKQFNALGKKYLPENQSTK